MTRSRNLLLATLAMWLWSLGYNIAAPLLAVFAMELGGGPVGAGVVGAAAAPRGGRPATPAVIAFSLAAGVGFTCLHLPSHFTVPYLTEVGRHSLLAAGFYSSLLAAAQVLWSLLFTVWPRRQDPVRVGAGRWGLTLPAGTLLAVAVCLGANGAFGLIMVLRPDAVVPALVLRGSFHALRSLGSALLGDVVAPGPARTTRITLAGTGPGVGAVLAPVAGGALYSLDPSLPFRVSALAALAGAAAVAAALGRARPNRTRRPGRHDRGVGPCSTGPRRWQ